MHGTVHLVLGTGFLAPGTDYLLLGTMRPVLRTMCHVHGVRYLVLGTMCLVLGTGYLAPGTQRLVVGDESGFRSWKEWKLIITCLGAFVSFLEGL